MTSTSRKMLDLILKIKNKKGVICMETTLGLLRSATILYLLVLTIVFLNMVCKRACVSNVVTGLLSAFFMVSAVCFLWG